MRCFIAIAISDEIRKAIGSIIEKLGPGQKGLRWTTPENIHITLKFLGETDEKVVPDIKARLSSICSNSIPFTLNIHGTGVFPNPKHPNVLWVGIDKSEEMKKLNMLIEGSLSELGFEKETREFSPHLTIGRVKDRKGIEPVIKGLYEFNETFLGTIHANEVLLMKSVLKPAGAEYSKVAVFKLSSDN